RYRAYTAGEIPIIRNALDKMRLPGTGLRLHDDVERPAARLVILIRSNAINELPYITPMSPIQSRIAFQASHATRDWVNQIYLLLGRCSLNNLFPNEIAVPRIRLL